jgi:hypothetical protein
MTTKVVITLLAVAQLALVALQLFVYRQGYFALLLGVMGIILEIIFIRQRKYEDNTLSRFLAEAVFLIPIILLL